MNFELHRMHSLEGMGGVERWWSLSVPAGHPLHGGAGSLEGRMVLWKMTKQAGSLLHNRRRIFVVPYNGAGFRCGGRLPACPSEALKSRDR